MLVSLVLGTGGATLRLESQSILDLNLFAGSWLIMAITLASVVARATFTGGRITYHRIMGAVLLYLTIAVAFAALFTFVGTVVPKAFSGMAVEASPALASQLVSFN